MMGISFLLIRQNVEMRPDLKSDRSRWVVRKVLLFCFCVHGVHSLAESLSEVGEVCEELGKP